MSQTTFDDTQWDVEPADPGVGIFSHTWSHTTCTEEYEQGVQEESTYAGRKVRNGMVYADETVTLTCLDCGAKTSFANESFMGFEGEQGV